MEDNDRKQHIIDIMKADEEAGLYDSSVTDQQVILYAVQVFGSEKVAKEWLQSYSIALGDVPLSLIFNGKAGAVSDELGRIEHGVLS